MSPLRRENTPSFKVNAAKNLWYDHGAGRGGTIIDLAMELEGLSSPAEAIRSISLSHPSYGSAAPYPPVPGSAGGTGAWPSAAERAATRAAPAKAAMEMLGTGQLASPALVRYLEEERGMPAATAARYLVEARYRSPDGRERASL